VVETDEEETDHFSSKMQSLHISDPQLVDQEPESAEVPVIVEHSLMEGVSEPKEPPSSEPVDSLSAQSQDEADQTVVEVEPDTKPEQGEEEEPNVVPIQSDENEANAAESTAQAPSSEEQTDDAESQPSADQATSPELPENEKEPLKQDATLDDMGGDSGPVPDPE
jgi:hypothetical protein